MCTAVSKPVSDPCPPFAPSGKVAFIGDAFFFPEAALRALSGEFAAIEALRLSDLKELPAANLKLLVIEETFSADLVARFSHYREAAGRVPVALAYRDVRLARRTLAELHRSVTLWECGFLKMSASLDAWLAALRLLMVGEAHVPVELLYTSDGAEVFAPTPRRSSAECGLSRREREVLGLVSTGRRNKVIARDLGLSEHTVKLHVHHVIKKLGVRNRTEAAQWLLAQRHCHRGGR